MFIAVGRERSRRIRSSLEGIELCVSFGKKRTDVGAVLAHGLDCGQQHGNLKLRMRLKRGNNQFKTKVMVNTSCHHEQAKTNSLGDRGIKDTSCSNGIC